MKEYKRIVIKVGTSVLAKKNGYGGISFGFVGALGAKINPLLQAGVEVVIVSSGAVAIGKVSMWRGDDDENLTIEQKQVRAAVGQPSLAHWFSIQLRVGKTGQVLLTKRDIDDNISYLNVRSTIEAMLAEKVTPIINENVSISTDEIEFGDNDHLSAHVANMIGADLLVILSDVDGLYTKAPHLEGAEHIPLVVNITQEMIENAGGAGNANSKGGMKTKLQAAKIATDGGTDVIIASGDDIEKEGEWLTNGPRTYFPSKEESNSSHRNRITNSLLCGEVTVSPEGAAVLKDQGLLPEHITSVEKDFGNGEMVMLTTERGEVLGYGLASHAGGRRCLSPIGMKPDEVEEFLGYKGRREMIKPYNLVLV